MQEQVVSPLKEQAIAILHTQDAANAALWYQRLGFSLEWVHRFEPNLPAFISIGRGDLRIFLSEHLGDARPGTSLYLFLPEVSDLARSFAVDVCQRPWADEIKLTDPDGNRLTIGTTPTKPSNQSSASF